MCTPILASLPLNASTDPQKNVQKLALVQGQYKPNEKNSKKKIDFGPLFPKMLVSLIKGANRRSMTTHKIIRTPKTKEPKVYQVLFSICILINQNWFEK